jgi:HD-like signal output (HDOD) protein
MISNKLVKMYIDVTIIGGPMETSPESLVSTIQHLVSLPEVCLKINHMIEQGDYEASALAKVISYDPDISARLLRLVNSAFYGLQSKVDSVQRAVTVTGAQELRNLVMATTVMKEFSGIPGDLVDVEDFWRHAIITGTLSQLISMQCHTLHPERLFLAGTLHDLGRLVIYLSLPDKAREVHYITGGDEWILEETEEEILGFGHTDVGAALFKSWKFPSSLQEVAHHHHRPSQASEDYQRDVSIVHIARAVSRGYLAGFGLKEMLWAIEPIAWAATGLDAESLIPKLPNMLGKASDAIAMFIQSSERITA